jgi:formylmethanofuran dehydrogenase subunit B
VGLLNADRRVEHVTCLGCGCGCDDLTVTVSDGRIADITPVCPIGRAWFGDGIVPTEIRKDDRSSSLEAALSEAAAILSGARGRCLIYLGLDITSQTQRAALRLADMLRATVDTATSPTAAEGLLAAQRRGRPAATLGEIRNRADVICFWGVDPGKRYPRYMARYAANPAGTHVGPGRPARTIIGVSVGSDRAIAGADVSLALQPDEEIPALSHMRATIAGWAIQSPSASIKQAVEIAARLAAARYAVLVHDAEPTAESRDPLRVEALIALTQALNTPTRAALSSLRGGGNRLGAEAVLTSQSGYPFAVDYSRGYPRYLPGARGLSRWASASFGAILLIGTAPEPWLPLEGSNKASTVIIGPRASQSALQPRIAIDTAVAGIHEAGTAYRMDEVPLELRPPLPETRSASSVIGSLADAVAVELRGHSR